MIETAHITVLDSWSGNCNTEECEKLCKETHRDLDKALKNGFRVKCITSCVLENRMLIHYVLERESE